MTTKNPHDLSQIRPVAELDRATGHSQPGREAPRGRQRRRSAPRRRRAWPMWAKLVSGAGVLLLAIMIGLVGLVYAVSPTQLVRDELVRQVKANTGRDLKIDGSARFSFYPSIAVALGNVSLSASSRERPLLTAERIDVSVALLPLLREKVQVKHIKLLRPVIDLHIDENGRRSWEAAGLPVAPVRVAQLGSGFGSWRSSIEASKNRVVQTAVLPSALPFDQFELGAITLSKATIFYRDDRSGISEQFDSVDLQLNGRRLTDPLVTAGDLLWRNQRLKFNAHVDAVARLIAGQGASVRATVSAPSVSGGFDGSLSLRDGPELKGQTRLESLSIARAADWLGVKLPNAEPLGGFALTGQLASTPKSISMSGASLQFGPTKAVGTATVTFGSGRPALNADLKLSELDVSKLAAGFAGATFPQMSAPRRHVAPKGSAPKSIEDILRRSHTSPKGGAGRFVPQVRGYTGRNEWSDKSIDVSQLRQLDAKARLKIDGLKVAGLVINRAIVRLALVDGAARADFDDLELYEGKGTGVVTAQPTRNGLGIGANIRVRQIEAKQLLADAAGFDHLLGRGDLKAVISGSGSNQKAIAESISGTAAFDFKGGAVIGWNLRKMMKGLQVGQFSGLKANPTERTDFSQLAATFKINQGVANTKDIRLDSPAIQVNGQGDIRIGARSLNLALQPKLITTWQGQTGSTDTTQLEIPVRLKGPWNTPRIVLDSDQYMKDPNKLANQAKELGRRLKGKNIGDIVRGVLGDSDGDRKKSKDILKKWLGR